MAGCDDRRITAQHQEFAMGEIDHPHHAEDDRQPDADERQAGYRVEDLDCEQSNKIHFHLSRTLSRTLPEQDLTAEQPSNLDHILLVVVRVLDEVAYGGGVRRFLLSKIFQHLELLVADLGDMDIEHAMMRWRVDGNLAGGRIDADAGFERLDDLYPVNAARLLDRLRPQPESLIGPHRELGDVGIIGTVAFEEARHERLVDRILQILEVIVTDQHAVAFVR